MFDINIHCIIFGVNESLNKRCLLSIDKEKIIFPYFKLDNANEINKTIISFLKDFIFVNPLVLIPQIISLNATLLNKSPNTLDIVFGFVVDYNTSIDTSKVSWVDFDPMIEFELSPIIFETMQKLT